jgi:hypothetical protein
MDIPNEVKKALEVIYKETSPVSIFLYGSRARGDATPDSDFEIGILYTTETKVGRSDLAKMHSIENLSLYPFIYEDFIRYQLDTPFPLALYLRSLFDGGAHTLYGETVVEKIKLPAVMVSDLLEEISFQIAYAVGALLSFRENDMTTARNQIVKAIIYGSRVLLIVREKKLLHRYDEILARMNDLELTDEYKDLLKQVGSLRDGVGDLQIQTIFTGIAYLNQVVRKEVKELLRHGNPTILEGAQIV